MERVNIILNRDSCCAADDGDDHHLTIKVPKTTTVPDLIWMLYQKYLWILVHGKWLLRLGVECMTTGDEGRVPLCVMIIFDEIKDGQILLVMIDQFIRIGGVQTGSNIAA